MSSSNQGDQQSGKKYTGLEPDHGDTKKQQADQTAQSGMTSGAVSVDHTKSGGSSGDISVGGSGSQSHQPHK